MVVTWVSSTVRNTRISHILHTLVLFDPVVYGPKKYNKADPRLLECCRQVEVEQKSQNLGTALWWSPVQEAIFPVSQIIVIYVVEASFNVWDV